MLPVAVGDAQFSRATAIFIGAAYASLHRFEVGKYILESPALVAQRGPVIVVALLAAVVHQAIDRSGTAQCLALGNRDATAVGKLGALCGELPRVAGIEDYLDKARGY